MDERVADIRAGRARELVWLLEHPPLYTAGTSAKPQDLLQPMRFAVHVAGRGGQYTYHGPGQRVVYAMLDLRGRRQDVRALRVRPRGMDHPHPGPLQRDGRAPCRPRGSLGGTAGQAALHGSPREDKIAAIGVRIRHWVSFHGLSINVEPDLSHYAGIVPCGIAEHGVTSLVDLGLPVTLADLTRRWPRPSRRCSLPGPPQLALWPSEQRFQIARRG